MVVVYFTDKHNLLNCYYCQEYIESAGGGGKNRRPGLRRESTVYFRVLPERYAIGGTGLY